MNYFFRILPKILFYPVYVAGWCGFLLCCAAVGREMYLSGSGKRKGLLLLAFAAAVVLLAFCPIRSARYIFLLAFPFTFWAAVFLVGVADCFGRWSVILLTVFTLALTTANTLKVLHTNSSARFAETAARHLQKSLAGKDRREILLVGGSRELGRIAHCVGCSFRNYPYPVENALDLALLQEHFCDRYKTLILVYSGGESHAPYLPAPFLSVRKKRTVLHFCRLDRPLPNVSGAVENGGKNLFRNADLTQMMDRRSVDRIKTFFQNNPAVLKIVGQQDFVWPYAWPFDHAGNYFPERDFDLKLDKTPQGENAIHFRSLSALPFFHSVAFPMEKNYLLSVKIRLLAASEISVRQYLKLKDGKVVVEEIKTFAGEAGSERILRIPVYPGRRMRCSDADRREGSFNLFFVLQHGDVQFSSFKLQEIQGNSLWRIRH